MAGHSQFKNIMHRKGRQDAVRSKMFSKLAREITVAVKGGLPDPTMNARLRLAIQNAKAQSMPKDNIERAIKKGSGARWRELRRGPLRRLWSGRRCRHRRGADRQPQPHRLQRPLDLHQGRRRAGRNRLRILLLRPCRRNLLQAVGRRCRQGDGSRDRSRCRGRDDRRGRPLHHLRFRRYRRSFQGAWKRRSAKPTRSRRSGRPRTPCRSTKSAPSR